MFGRKAEHSPLATRRHGDTATQGSLMLRSGHLGRLFAPQMTAKTSPSRYWAVSPHQPPSANIRARNPPVSLEPGRPPQQDRAAGEARSFPERLGSDVGLFLGRRSHPVGDMATPATVFFSCSLAGSPIPSSTPPRGTQKYPPLPLKGGGGISSPSDLGGSG